MQFNKTVKEFGATIVESKDANEQITRIESEFDKYTHYLYQLVKHLAYKGSFKELYLRLDFNKFYDKGNNIN